MRNKTETAPFPNARMKGIYEHSWMLVNQPWKEGGEGGHTSTRENNANQQKEPENTPDHDRFIPKGALMHTQILGHTCQKGTQHPQEKTKETGNLNGGTGGS